MVVVTRLLLLGKTRLDEFWHLSLFFSLSFPFLLSFSCLRKSGWSRYGSRSPGRSTRNGTWGTTGKAWMRTSNLHSSDPADREPVQAQLQASSAPVVCQQAGSCGRPSLVPPCLTGSFMEDSTLQGIKRIER